jgi:hypothetical protein
MGQQIYAMKKARFSNTGSMGLVVRSIKSGDEFSFV